MALRLNRRKLGELNKLANMARERKAYPKEFKVMSVELSNTRSDLTALAKELDIKPSLLYRWRKEYSSKPSTSFPGNGKVISTEAEQEVARLKKELRETQMERDILKKAVSIFSKSDGKYSGS
jgi:transposase